LQEEPTGRQSIAVEIVDNQDMIPLDRCWCSELARFTLQAESVPAADVSVAFVDNATIRRLNKRFLAHDYPTDVITFPLSADGEPLGGEVVISVEYAVGQAARYANPVELEIGLYLVHGLLHLCGYDDAAPDDAARMRRRQEELLRRFVGRRAPAATNDPRKRAPVPSG
jgi:probable rRNA maturation factor